MPSFTFLDFHTLCTLFDAPGPDVQATIERDGWGGMPWPGHEDWAAPATLSADDMRAGTQVLSLAIHYFSSRHPGATAIQICTAAQVLAQYAVAFVGGYPVEEAPLWEQVEAWVLSLAGGVPPAPGEIISLTPPLDAERHALVPGNDIPAFTRAIVPIVEALVFGDEAEARRLAQTFLTQAGDDRATRAAEIFQRGVLGQVRDLDADITCADCQREDLEIWYTGQVWGETLCEVCYEARRQTGTARPHQEDA